MGRWNDKYVIGLTGNIAMGKSLVRRMLEHLGAYTIDADGLSHQVMAPNAPAYQPVIEQFGKFVLSEDGQIDRARLGAIVFSHPDALQSLEKITHPIISTAIDTLISRSKHHVIVVEAIKLLEGNLAEAVDAIWVVDSAPEHQLARLMQKRGLSEPDARKRISVQNPQSDKLAKADVVITNNSSPDEAWSRVQAEWQKIRQAELDTQAVEVVETVKVEKKEQPLADLAPASTATPSTAVSPALAQQSSEIEEFSIKRPRPADFDMIAKLINTETGKNVTKVDVMVTFGEKTYMMAEANAQAVGIIGFLVENLVTRVDEFVLSQQAPAVEVGTALIKAMEKASDELQSEVAFVFLSKSDEVGKKVFTDNGYEVMDIKEVRYPAWREAVNEFYAEDKILLSKRLRESLVLKPI